MCERITADVVCNTAQNSSDNLPSYPPDIITARILSTWMGAGMS